jgi:hypothetical protein
MNFIKATKRIYLLASIFLCTTAGAQNPNPESSKPLAFGISDQDGGVLGLEFSPPEGGGWSIKRSGAGISVKKKGASANENTEIEGYIIKLDMPMEPISDYIERIKKNIQKDYETNSRFEIKLLEVVADPARPSCAKFHVLLQDRTDTKWYSEQYALSCGLKKYRGMGVELRYFNRYYEQNRDGQLAEEANRILESIVIHDR